MSNYYIFYSYFILMSFYIPNSTQNVTPQYLLTTTIQMSTSTHEDEEFLSSTTEDYSSSTSITDTTLMVNCQNDCKNHEENFTTISPVILLDVTSNCQNGCWGGICYEGICQCKEGLILNVELNDCIMPCETTCQNGVCNQDRICECNQGFIFDNQSDAGCVPQCDRKCVNSICVAPTHCECIKGDISMLNISSALECLPTCEDSDGEPGCQNGTCVAVNKCQCFDGFFLNPNDRYECIVNLTFDTWDLTRRFFYLLWIICILTMLIVSVIGCLVYKKMRCVSYNIQKIEKYHSAVAYQNNHEQLDCVL